MLKTQATDASVNAFLQTVTPETKREDAIALLHIFERVTQEPARMWGSNIIGFGEYTYTNARKQKLKWMRCAFSPRKRYLSAYLMAGVEANPILLAKLGKFKHGKSCLNFNKLSDIDTEVLEALIHADMEIMHARYPT